MQFSSNVDPLEETSITRYKVLHFFVTNTWVKHFTKTSYNTMSIT